MILNLKVGRGKILSLTLQLDCLGSLVFSGWDLCTQDITPLILLLLVLGFTCFVFFSLAFTFKSKQTLNPNLSHSGYSLKPGVPQGLTLFFFPCCLTSSWNLGVRSCFGLCCHQYTDPQQLPAATRQAVERLDHGLEDSGTWRGWIRWNLTPTRRMYCWWNSIRLWEVAIYWCWTGLCSLWQTTCTFWDHSCTALAAR